MTSLALRTVTLLQGGAVDPFDSVVNALNPTGYWRWNGTGSTITDLTGNGADFAGVGTYTSGTTSPLGDGTAYTMVSGAEFAVPSANAGHLQSLTEQTWLMMVEQTGNNDGTNNLPLNWGGVDTRRGFRIPGSLTDNDIRTYVNRTAGTLIGFFPAAPSLGTWQWYIYRYRVNGANDELQSGRYVASTLTMATAATGATSPITAVSGLDLNVMNNGLQSNMYNGKLAALIAFNSWLSDADLTTIGDASGV